MTIAAIQAVFAHYAGSPADKFVLLALADRADKTSWECYPSVGDTAARTGYCPRTVKASLKRLEQEGVIVRIRYGGVKGSHGGMPTNRYRIVRSFLVPDGAADALSDRAAGAPWDGAGDSPSAVPRGISRPAMVQLTPADGAGGAPEPRDEPSKDPREGPRTNAEARRRISPVCPHCDASGREPDGADCRICGGNGVNPDFRFEKRRGAKRWST